MTRGSDAAVVAWTALKEKNQAQAEARVAALMRGETPAEVPDIADADAARLDRIRRRSAAVDWHNKAMQLVATDKHLAYRLICSSITVDPTFASGAYMMGNVAADLEKFTAAVASYRRALQLPDDDLPGGMTPDLRAKCMLNLSHRLTNLGENEEALSVGLETIAMLEAHPELDVEGRAFAYTNMAQILMVFSREEEALAYALKGWEMSQIPIVELGLAFALLFSGDFARGLKHFESRFGYRLTSYLEYPYDRWDGKLNHDKTLFVVSEQGLGDTISFARFLGMAGARCKKVIFQVHPELHRLMTSSLKHWGNVEVVPMQPQYPMADFPVADAWCSVMSLPVAMGLTTEEITDKAQGWVAKYEKRPAPEWKYPGAGLHIGIAWAGSAANGIDRWRSVPFSMFLELARAGVHLYSIQVGERVKDLHEECAAALVRDLSPYIRDVSDTCAILDELDLVITVESFLGHLCGAMGTECWLLASRLGGDWRVSRHRHRPLWYDTTKLFRQQRDLKWGGVFRRIVTGLTERVSGSKEPVTLVGQTVKIMTFETAAEAWTYDPDTGIFTWRKAGTGKAVAGGIAGTRSSGGYWVLKLNKEKWQAHRIAWLLMTGEYPTHEIDHVNRDPIDNRWDNLRAATRSQNCSNKLVTNKIGYRGVKENWNRWSAVIKVKGKEEYLGTFPTKEEAAWAYDQRAAGVFGKFAVLNFPDGPPTLDQEALDE